MMFGLREYKRIFSLEEVKGFFGGCLEGVKRIFDMEEVETRLTWRKSKGI